MDKKLLSFKFQKWCLVLSQYGRGDKVFMHAIYFIENKELDQIIETDLSKNPEADLVVYFDTGNLGSVRPHWQGYCYIDPGYDSEEFREKLVDYLLEQKIVEKPVLIGFTGWDRSGKVQGSVGRCIDGKDIFLSGD